MTYWGNYKLKIYKISKTFHLKIPFEENMFFGEKDPKKDNSPKCKVNTLAHYMSFEPTWALTKTKA
jgi:hypothetical protein